tara:strand:- start:646 stop:3630 length:2985 start_codon:yes stop_codon:yes gene_type:complete
MDEKSPIITQNTDEKEDDDISIDFSKIKNIFKKTKSESSKEEEKLSEPSHTDDKEEKDEDISLDFSKIKNIFKKSDQEKQKGLDQSQESPDEEINIDFSKIKNIFKRSESIPKTYDNNESEDINVDWSKIFKFFSKYGFLFLLLIPILISINIRMIPENLPLTEDWAQNAVFENIRSNMKSQVNQQYPNLPDPNKDEIVEREFQNFLKNNQGEINNQLKGTSDFFKEHYRDEEGKTYMPDIDPYYWLRYANNIINSGTTGDVIKAGRPFDNYQLAPEGRFVTQDMYHAYFLAYFHKITRIISPQIPLTRSMSFYPVLISALSVLFAFIIGKKIAGNVGGFFAALMLAVSQSFVGRTLFGHADSDAWVVFFPLLITLLFLEALESENKIKSIAYSLLGGIVVGFFSFSWSGWWYIFDFLLGVAGVTFIYFLFIYRNKIKTGIKSLWSTELSNIVIASLVFFISSAIFVIIFHNFAEFLIAFNPLGFSSSVKAPVTPSLWPNVLTTVAELNPGSYDQVVSSMGGKLLWYLGLLGIILATLKRDKKNRIDIKYSVLLLFWLASTSYASLLGIRFTLLVAPAFSIAFGTTLGISYKYISKWAAKELHIHRTITSTIFILLLLMFYVNPINGSMNAAKHDIPLVNDAWYNSLTSIKTNSTEDAIITSWWDFGHHFKVIADRPVTFDGTTQTSQPAHWVGKFFSTHNEEEALGILRLLNCGANNAFKSLREVQGGTINAVSTLKEIAPLNNEEAKKRLEEYGLTDIQLENTTSFTHCTPPQSYVIASNDMVGKSGVWGHFGAWNFQKADIWFNVRKMGNQEAVNYMVENFNYTKEHANDIYLEVQSIGSNEEANSWVAPWPGFGGTASCSLAEDNSSLECSNGFTVNLTNYEIYAHNQQEVVYPKLFAYLDENEEFQIKEFADSTIDLGITLIKKEESNYELIISSPELTGGMFTRMFYMGGKGLKYFTLLDHQRGITGTEIYTYFLDMDKVKKLKGESY